MVLLLACINKHSGPKGQEVIPLQKGVLVRRGDGRPSCPVRGTLIFPVLIYNWIINISFHLFISWIFIRSEVYYYHYYFGFSR